VTTAEAIAERTGIRSDATIVPGAFEPGTLEALRTMSFSD
jgi:hypothetical protein